MTLQIQKNADGLYTFAGILSNNVTDRDGETFSLASHNDYVSRFDAGKTRKPLLLYWHEPIPVGIIKEVWVEKGFLAVAGEFFKPFNSVAKGLINSKEQWGMSLGIPSGEYEREHDDNTVFKSYTLIEGSILPVNRAANFLTGFNALKKGLSMKLSEEKRLRLQELVGADQMGELMKTINEYAIAVEEEEMPTKEVNDNDTDEIVGESLDEVEAVDGPVDADDEIPIIDPRPYITPDQLEETVTELVKAFRAEIDEKLEALQKSIKVEKTAAPQGVFTGASMIAKAFADEAEAHEQDIVKDADELASATPKITTPKASTGNIFLDAIASSFTGEN